VYEEYVEKKEPTPQYYQAKSYAPPRVGHKTYVEYKKPLVPKPKYYKKESYAPKRSYGY
jgi:hypothetical protein